MYQSYGATMAGFDEIWVEIQTYCPPMGNDDSLMILAFVELIMQLFDYMIASSLIQCR